MNLFYGRGYRYIFQSVNHHTIQKILKNFCNGSFQFHFFFTYLTFVTSFILPFLIDRLEKSIADSSPDILPFEEKKNLFENLNETSLRFRELLIGYDAETQRNKGNFSPVSTLDKTIRKM